MPSLTRRLIGASCVAILGANLASAADQTRTAPPTKGTPAATSSASSRPGAARSGAKGPLPDPTLLDGSTQPAEKKSEHGMIGEFELPGDENARSGKVGGPQNPNSAPGVQVNIPMGLPQSGGGLPGQQQQGGGLGGAQTTPAGQQQGGAQAGGPQNPAAAGNPVAGAGDPGAQAQGIQVAELGGEGSAQGAGAGLEDKPKQMSIGDSSMRIEQSANIPGVVGAQQQQTAGQTQQHEKGTGSGGKGAGGAGSGNRVEKGRAIPAGL